MNGLGRILMIIGGAVFLIGALVWIISKAGLPLGRLPGDAVWEGKNVKVYVPFATMILVSVVLTVLLNVIARFGKK
ncbi:MAG: DUF2905 domain-containing protein [Synergistaceae bacterium]|jgi:hypothetical protein|nr:DUF2905 domain-containing protein [Synergistaceae bacterium]